MKIRQISLFFFLISIFPVSYAQRGKSGSVTINTANKIVNEYTTLTVDAAVGSTTIAVAASSLNANTRFGAGNNLAAGDLIMIIQMQGATILGAPDVGTPTISNPNDATWGGVTNYNNSGKYEYVEVSSVPNATTITIDCGLTYDYTVSGKVQIVRIPRYNTLTITTPGILTCQAWNGTTGGILAVEVAGNTTINSGGKINVTGAGFRGGALFTTSGGSVTTSLYSCVSSNVGTNKGESIAGYDSDYTPYGGKYCRGAAANAGGGGNYWNCGGGGGANAGNIATWTGQGNPDNTGLNYSTAWNLESPGFSASTSSGGGRGGYSFSNSNQNAITLGPGTNGVNNAWGGSYRVNFGGLGARPLDYSTGRIFLGGGGGAGDQDNNQGGAGGSGGGIIYFTCYGNITGSGNDSIIANGNNGGSSNISGLNPGKDAAGGAGGGGVIILNTTGNIVGVVLKADGGRGGYQLQGTLGLGEAEGPGGGGGGGYIAITNGTPVQISIGGANGITQSPQLTEFLPNGATKGADGLINQTISRVDTVLALNDTICSGNTATLNASINGTIPATINWYSVQTGGSSLGTGPSFTTPTLTTNTTYYVGFCPGTYRIPVNVIVTSSIVPSVSIAITSGTNPMCTGSSTTFTATPTNGGTTPSYQWQINGVNAGANSSTFTSSTLTNGDAVTCILTSSSSCANPLTATSTPTTMTVTSSVTPSVSITITSGTNPMCTGSSTTFTATVTNGGTTPSYQWQVNGTNVGTNSSTYTTAGLTNGQIVTCILTSNSPCASPLTATSTGITMTVASSVSPSVVIAQTTGSNPMCTGSSITFTATPTNGGITPSYQWQVNGVNAGTNSSTFTSSILTNGDAVTCIMTSNSPCASPLTATSAGITMTVTSSAPPSVVIVLTTGSNPMCTGSSTTFTATPTNGGTTPSYQWQVNGANVGTNSSTYTTTGLTNGQTVTCILTSNSPCASPLTATSVGTTMTLTSSVAPSVSIALTSGSNPMCTGASATFTATPTNGGTTPSYQWQVNGANVGINSSTYTTAGLTNGQIVTCILTSNSPCAIPLTATSTGTTMVITNPTVNAGSDVTIISGTSTTLTGTVPVGSTYSWNPSTFLTCDTCTSTIASPLTTTTYTLTATQNGCSSSDVVTVFVNVECGELFVPNVFSPNGDNENDVLKVYGNCITSLELLIFDRWGEKVFETTDISYGWDGTYKGKKLDDAVFVYYLNATVNGIKVKKHGNISLVK